MSEFRKDIVSGDWIVMAPERSNRPHGIKEAAKKRKPSPRRTCPFEHPERTGNWPPIHQWPKRGPWQILLIPNKYPALQHGDECAVEEREGVYSRMEGVGWHDLVVTRDHVKDFPKLTPRVAAQVLAMFQERYRDARKNDCLQYVSAFGNWGASAGASLFHPHYQLLSLPIIPPHVGRALRGSERYFRKHKRCAHCDIIAEERKRGTGLIAENAHAVALAPFASRDPYSVKIFPKRHESRFGSADAKTLRAVAALLQKVLGRVERRLGDPDYNFFIHSAPLHDAAKHHHYHWHMEVEPKISVDAGFELSTGIEINIVSPEQAAKLLR
jgi:UDPglucose--hexose-1-phosphate uridylyltransferase